MINGLRIKERLEELSTFGCDNSGGWSRFSYTSEYNKACMLIRKWMEEVGMQVRRDPIGNIFGYLPGEKNTFPIVASGSHIDSVETGGMFDGNVGVIGAIEVVQSFRENGINNIYPVEVIVFVEEDSGRFGGLIGSRAMVEGVSTDFLHLKKDKNGISIAEAMKTVGLNPEKANEVKVDRDKYRCFFELHIEQSCVLENLGLPVGIAEGIAGAVVYKVSLKGRSNHAGATPMNMRRDCMPAAAEIVLAVERVAESESGVNTVATVGKLNVIPGVGNIIPGEVEMLFEIRDIDEYCKQKALKKILYAIDKICKRRRINYNIEELMRTPSILLKEPIISVLEESAMKLDIPYHKMISGAGHDAQMMAEITDVGMIFIPSKNGASHCPEEFTDYKDIEKGVKVLYEAMLSMVSC